MLYVFDWKELLRDKYAHHLRVLVAQLDDTLECTFEVVVPCESLLTRFIEHGTNEIGLYKGDAQGLRCLNDIQ